MVSNKFTLTIKCFIVFFAFLSGACEKEVSVSQPLSDAPLADYFISSYPEGARIFIDGKNTGFITPDTLKMLEPRVQSISLKKDLWIDYQSSISPETDIVNFLNADFRDVPGAQGSIKITSNVSEASVFINDNNYKVSLPYRIENLYPGEYIVTLAKDKFVSDSSRITVKSSNQTLIHLSLKDTTIWVDFSKTNSGIVTNILKDIAIDEEENIWIASFNGLIKFDGKEFTLFTDENSILQSNEITSVFIDSKENLWIGTSKGLIKKSGENWELFDVENSKLSGNYITCIEEGPNGTYWIGTMEGITRIQDDVWDIYTTENSGLSSNWVLSIGINKDNVVLAGTNFRGLNQFKDNKWSRFILPEFIFLSPTAAHIEADQTGTFWIAFHPESDTEPGGLISLTDGNITLREVFTMDLHLQAIFVDEFDNKWICTKLGITLYDRENQVSQPGESGLCRSWFTGAVRDKKGNYWLTTANKGLVKYKRYLDE